jgi:lipoyl(octanoyl) transferase
MSLPNSPALSAYLLGRLDFEAALRLQRGLVYDVGGDRDRGALVLCEHPLQVTIGRDGGPAQLRADPTELRARGVPVRWVNRGGGCLPHGPGQLAVYSVVALDRLGLGLSAYVGLLREVLLAVLDDFNVSAAAPAGESGVRAGGRLVGAVGVAVRGWVAYYGAYLNVGPDLTAFRVVNSGLGDGAMTSLERERRGAVRPGLVRERLLEHYARFFGVAHTALFTDHPLLRRPPRGATRPAPA